MSMWLPELIGGIWPNDELTRNYTRYAFSATEDVCGHVNCSACPAKFVNVGQLTLHRRQVHNVYGAGDSKVVMSKSTAGLHSQRLVKLAQQTSRIQMARVSGDSDSWKTVGGASVEVAVHEAEHRGFKRAPHSAWAHVLNQGVVSSARGPSRR